MKETPLTTKTIMILSLISRSREAAAHFGQRRRTIHEIFLAQPATLRTASLQPIEREATTAIAAQKG